MSSTDNLDRTQAARLLGSIKSQKKSSAARANGKLGGRPKGSTDQRKRNPARKVKPTEVH